MANASDQIYAISNGSIKEQRVVTQKNGRSIKGDLLIGSSAAILSRCVLGDHLNRRVLYNWSLFIEEEDSSGTPRPDQHILLPTTGSAAYPVPPQPPIDSYFRKDRVITASSYY